MTYFSRFTASPRELASDQLALRTHKNAYREHQLLWQCFADDPDASRDFIFRREDTADVKYYVVSERPPNKCTPWHIETKTYDPKISEHETLMFSLRANPVIRRKGSDGKSRRHDVVMDAKHHLTSTETVDVRELITAAGTEWLKSRAIRFGFSVDESSLRVDGYAQHRSVQPRKNHAIQFSTLDFNGLLTVTDATRFTQALMSGVGPGKAFGCGLLLVRRP